MAATAPREVQLYTLGLSLFVGANFSRFRKQQVPTLVIFKVYILYNIIIIVSAKLGKC